VPFKLSCPIVEQWQFLFNFGVFEDCPEGPEATDAGRLEKMKSITAMVTLGTPENPSWNMS
jgi:hypothetical protein